MHRTVATVPIHESSFVGVMTFSSFPQTGVDGLCRLLLQEVQHDMCQPRTSWGPPICCTFGHGPGCRIQNSDGPCLENCSLTAVDWAPSP